MALAMTTAMIVAMAVAMAVVVAMAMAMAMAMAIAMASVQRSPVRQGVFDNHDEDGERVWSSSWRNRSPRYQLAWKVDRAYGHRRPSKVEM
jgi:hypothetical protein